MHGTAWYNDPAEDLAAIAMMQRSHARNPAAPHVAAWRLRGDRLTAGRSRPAIWGRTCHADGRRVAVMCVATMARSVWVRADPAAVSLFLFPRLCGLRVERVFVFRKFFSKKGCVRIPLNALSFSSKTRGGAAW